MKSWWAPFAFVEEPLVNIKCCQDQSLIEDGLDLSCWRPRLIMLRSEDVRRAL